MADILNVPKEPLPNLHVLTVLALVYAALLLSASLMPFDLTKDRDEAAAGYAHAWEMWPFGDKIDSSASDMFSNFLAYVPVGCLAAARLVAGGRMPAVPAMLIAMGASFLMSLTAEGLQLFSVRRFASAQDVIVNTAGGCLGALSGAAGGRAAWARLERTVQARLVPRPAGLAAAVLCLYLAVDALCPYYPTLDASTVWGNLKRSQLNPVAGLAQHPWHHWAVERAGLYAALTAAFAAASLWRDWPRWVRGAFFASCFAAALEACKPLIHTRAANTANVAAAAAGAAGAMAVGLLRRRPLPAKAKRALCVAALAGYLCYVEWRPFAFVWTAAQASHNAPSGAAWLPLYHPAMRGRPADLQQFVSRLAIMAALTWAVWRRRRQPVGRSIGTYVLVGALFGAAAGALAELPQLFLPGRYPTPTDVFTFALGGALAGWALHSSARSEPSDVSYSPAGVAGSRPQREG